VDEGQGGAVFGDGGACGGEVSHGFAAEGAA
jgi:hypothetical protein